MDERLEICYKALMCRHKRLLGTPSDVAPILWQNGALARLKKGETLDKLLFGGYSTISLGYAGLYECVKHMTGKSHTDVDAKPFALAVMQRMNDKCKEWKAEKNIDFSLTIDDKVVQSANSSQMLFSVDEVIAYVSRFCTLKTGDLIFTGTPAGVGPVSIGTHLKGFLGDEKVLDFHVR